MTRHLPWTVALVSLALVSAGACKKQESTSPDTATAAEDADAEDADAEDADAEEAASILTKSSFEETVTAHFSDVSDCYVAALEDNSKLSGQLIAEFTIDGEGKVTGLVAVDGSTLVDEGMLTCISERAQGWGFDRPSGESMTLQYPFNLAPAN